MTTKKTKQRLIEELRLNVDPKLTPGIRPRIGASQPLRDPNVEIKRNTEPQSDSFLYKFRCEKSLYPWQKKIYNAIREGHDVFVSVSPAGGKTMPVTCALGKKIIETYFKNRRLYNSTTIRNRVKQFIINKRQHSLYNDVPLNIKILWVTPLQQLNYQLYNEIVQNVVGQALLGHEGLFKEITFQNPKMIEDFLRMYVGAAAGSTPPYAKKPDKLTIVDICTYELASQYLSKFRYDIIVIDEFQEAFRTDEDKKRVNAYYKLFTYKKCKQFIMLTGSTNEVLIDDFIEWQNKVFKRNYIKLQFDKDIAGNKSQVLLVPTTELDNKNLDKFVERLVVTNSTNNLIITFSKILIYRTCEKLIKKLPVINSDLYYSLNGQKNALDKGEFRIHLINYFKDELRHLRKRSGQPPYSEDELNRLATQKVANMSKNQWNKFVFDEKFQRYLKSKNINVKRPSEEKAEDFIYECIARGIGFLVGGTKGKSYGKETWVDQYLSLSMQQKEMVQKLFEKGKIRVLFATDAVGIGVNLKVRNLYIPTVKKFDGSVITSIDTSSLLQLIMRAGRDVGRFPYATIYCHPNDYDYINCLLSQEHYLAVKNPINLSTYSNKKQTLRSFMIQFSPHKFAGECEKYVRR